MLIAAWLGIMAMLTFYFSDVEENLYNPNRDIVSNQFQGFTEITLKRNAQGHYVANGEINGEPVTFLLDTGATMVAIPYHMKSRLQLTPGAKVPVRTANGISSSYTTTIDELRLGNIVATNIRGGLATGFEGNEILLGMSFLSGLELIQRGDSLTIRKYD